MNTEMNGRKVRRFATSEGCYVDDGSTTGKGAGWHFIFSATYHGDRDEFWIIHYDYNNREVSRWNASKVLHIEWSEEQP